MTPDRLDRIQALYLEALDRPAEERERFLEEACSGDAELRREVLSLLEVDTTSFMEDSLANVQEMGALPPDETTMEGRRIGPYRIVEELGRGGMGVVYLAERADGQFEQTVALKLVKRGMDTDAILARFLNERQVLASLQHPHIARLYDGGVAPASAGAGSAGALPYFAMEYIDGVPITDYCNEHRLSIDERLALFEKVCRAVEHAHNRLIIHRDLKPSNILITEDGEPRLLDFGLAKVLQEPSGDEPITRTGRRWMTLEYASPEQVKGDPIGTPSDTYQLGLILYELLTGKRAYIVSGLSPTEAERLICEVDPPRPSMIVASGNGATPHTGPALPPDRLRRRLKGDIDTIILKALHKDPTRGYSSAETLANDIERHRQGLPINARSDTTGYRVRKFVQRHRQGVVVAAGVVAVIAGLVTFYTLRLQNERDQARTEAEKSEQVTNFLVQVFESGDPSETMGEELTARELLDRGVERAAELADQPEIQAEMLSVIAQAHEGMGDYGRAQSLFERALSIRKNLLGPDHLQIASSMEDLAWLHKNKGEYESAESYAREALAMQRRLLGEDNMDVAKSLNVLAQVLTDQGDYEEAEPHARKSLAIRRRLLNDQHEDVVTGMNNLALLLHSKGNYAEAESLYRRVVAVDRDQLEPVDPYLANDLHNLGFLLMDKGDYDAAEPVFQEALSITREVYGDDHPLLALRMSAMARLFRQQDRYEEAEQLLRQSLDINRRFRGQQHPLTISDVRNLGVLHYLKGDYETAERHMRSALALYREELGEEHPNVAVSLATLGRLLRSKGEHAEAERYFREALAMQRRLLDEHHLEIASTLVGLSRVLADQNRAEEAELYAREAFNVRRHTLPETDWRVAETKVVLGRSLALQSFFEEAEPILLDGYDILRGQRGETNRLTQEALRNLSLLYENWDRTEEAARYSALLDSAE